MHTKNFYFSDESINLSKITVIYFSLAKIIHPPERCGITSLVFIKFQVKTNKQTPVSAQHTRLTSADKNRTTFSGLLHQSWSTSTEILHL